EPLHERGSRGVARARRAGARKSQRGLWLGRDWAPTRGICSRQLNSLMKVLALCSYPTEAAATRYRLNQFQKPLAERGMTLTIHPFLDAKLFERLYRREALPRTALSLTKSGLLRIKDLVAAT